MKDLFKSRPERFEDAVPNMKENMKANEFPGMEKSGGKGKALDTGLVGKSMLDTGEQELFDNMPCKKK